MKYRIPFALLLLSLLCLLLWGCDQAPEATPHDHVADAWQTVIPPTCSAEGKATGTCLVCGEAMDKTLPTVAHTYTDTVIPPACDTEGYTRHACACGYTYDSHHVPPTGHTYQKTLTPPACEAEGYTHYECACGFAYDGDREPPTGHSFTKTLIPPACETEGYTRYACACGYTYDGAYTPPTGHSYTKTVTEPTCEGEGYTHYECACGYAYDGELVPPVGHQLDQAVTVPPTCTEAGYTHYLCAVCGHGEEGETIPPLNHANSVAEAFFPTVLRDGFTRHTCLDCGHIAEDSFVPYHEIYTGAYVDNTESLMQGIDTSKWNHEYGVSPEDIKPLDWEALKAAGVDFVILKAGSTKGIDPAFELDYKDAKAAGLQVGAYFYTYATTAEATLADAEMLLGWLEGKQFELPIYLDAEDPSISALGQERLMELCVTFTARLQEAGYYAALYTNTEWLYNLLDTAWVKANLDIWYARYTVTPPEGRETFSPTDTGFPWKDGTAYKPGETDLRYGLWQYTDSGGIEGFRYRFDFNYAFKDYRSIMVKWGLNGFAAL